MALIYLLEELFGKIVFSIGEYKFEGIRPVSYLEYLWENSEDREKYRKELESENTTYSYKKFIYWEEKMQCQKMHIKLSRSLLYRVGAIIFLFFSWLLLLKENEIVSLFFLILSILLFIISLILKLRVKKICTSIGLGRIINDQFESWPD